MNEELKGTYRHFKGGLYKVIDVAFHSEDSTKRFVLYQSIVTEVYWVRPYNNFFEEISPNKTRFTKI